jgi:K+-sensing histidine kinase KdpD
MNNSRFLGTLVFALIISAIHFLTFDQQAPALFFVHTLLTKLYFLPVLLAAFWNGKRGAIFLSLIVTVFFLPHVIFHEGNSKGLIFENVSEITILWIVGIISGILSDKVKSSHAEKSRLAAVKKVSNMLSVINHEILIDYEACLGLTKAFAGIDSTRDGNSMNARILLERLEHLGSHLGNLQQLVLPKTLTKKKCNLVHIVKNSITEIEKEKSYLNIDFSNENDKPFLYLDVKRMQFAFTNIMHSLLNGKESFEKVNIAIRKKSGFYKIYLHFQSSTSRKIKKWNLFDLYADPKRGYIFTLALSVINSHGGKFMIEDTTDNSITFCLFIPMM